jgi:hypothetical protein
MARIIRPGEDPKKIEKGVIEKARERVAQAQIEEDVLEEARARVAQAQKEADNQITALGIVGRPGEIDKESPEAVNFRLLEEMASKGISPMSVGGVGQTIEETNQMLQDRLDAMTPEVIGRQEASREIFEGLAFQGIGRQIGGSLLDLFGGGTDEFRAAVEEEKRIDLEDPYASSPFFMGRAARALEHEGVLPEIKVPLPHPATSLQMGYAGRHRTIGLDLSVYKEKGEPEQEPVKKPGWTVPPSTGPSEEALRIQEASGEGPEITNLPLAAYTPLPWNGPTYFHIGVKDLLIEAVHPLNWIPAVKVPSILAKGLRGAIFRIQNISTVTRNRPYWKWTSEKFADEYYRLDALTGNSEVKHAVRNLSPAEQEMLGADWKAALRKMGYKLEEVNNLEKYLDIHGKGRFTGDEILELEQVQFRGASKTPSGYAASQGDMADYYARIDFEWGFEAADIVEALHKKGFDTLDVAVFEDLFSALLDEDIRRFVRVTLGKLPSDEALRQLEIKTGAIIKVLKGEERVGTGKSKYVPGRGLQASANGTGGKGAEIPRSPETPTGSYGPHALIPDPAAPRVNGTKGYGTVTLEFTPNSEGQVPGLTRETTQRTRADSLWSAWQTYAREKGLLHVRNSPAIEKLSMILRKQRISVTELAGVQTDELARRIAEAHDILRKEHDPTMGFEEVKRVLAGALPTGDASYETIILEADELVDIFGDIAKAYETKQLTFFDAFNTDQALKDLLSGALLQDAQIQRLEDLFGSGLANAIRSRRGALERVGTTSLDIINFPQGILASFDMSAPFRQGILLLPGHPKEFANSMVWMAKAFASEDVARQVAFGIKSRPRFESWRRLGLYYAEYGATVSATDAEFEFMSRFARTLPGFNMSARSHATFLNKLRWDVAETIVDSWEKSSAFWEFDRSLVGSRSNPLGWVHRKNAGVTEKDLKELFLFLNRATGRGGLGPLEPFAGLLGPLHFSLRLQMSRILLPLSLITSTPLVRKQAARDLSLFFGNFITLLTLAKLSGMVDVEMNPLSSKFGRMKSGKTTYDLSGGIQPYIRFMAQVSLGRSKSLTKEQVQALDRWDAAMHFWRTKLSPPAAFLVDLKEGETLRGEELSFESPNVRNYIKEHLTPLFAQDVWDAIEEEGLPGLFKALPGFFGVTIHTFSTTRDAVNSLLEDGTIVITDEDGEIITDYADPRITALQYGQIHGHPEVVKLINEQRALMRDREEEFSVRSGGARIRQLARDEQWGRNELNAAEWRDQLSIESLVGAALGQERELRRGDLLDDPRNANERFLVAWYDLVSGHRLPGADLLGAVQRDMSDMSTEELQVIGRNFDLEGFIPAAEKFMAALPPTARQYVLDNAHPNRTPYTNLYYESQQELKDFWTIPEKMAKTEAQLELYEKWQSLDQNQKRQFSIANSSVIGLGKRIQVEQDKMRRRSRTIDTIMIVFYGRSPLHPANIKESKGGIRATIIKERFLQEATRKLEEKSRVR